MNKLLLTFKQKMYQRKENTIFAGTISGLYSDEDVTLISTHSGVEKRFYHTATLQVNISPTHLLRQYYNEELDVNLVVGFVEKL